MKTFKCGHPDTKQNRRSNGVRNGVQTYRCKMCKRAANSAYQKNNPEKVAERNRRVREKYPDKERERKKKWRQETGKFTEYMRKRRREQGIPEWGSPECKEKMSKAALARIARDGWLPKPSPSKLELSCIPMFAKQGYKHTGDGSFWIRGKDGKSKNPDFLNKKSKSVIEVWGDYWHRGQDPKDLIVWYKKNGYDCKIYWESELKASIY